VDTYADGDERVPGVAADDMQAESKLLDQERSSDQSSTSDSTPSEARKRGSGGGSPRKSDDPAPGPSDLSKHQIDHLHSSDQSSTSDSTPSEARKRGSGGGSPRKSDDPAPGPSDLSKHQIDHLHSSDGALPPTARRAKRENGDMVNTPISHILSIFFDFRRTSYQWLAKT
jgi:hypothetical protein